MEKPWYHVKTSLRKWVSQLKPARNVPMVNLLSALELTLVLLKVSKLSSADQNSTSMPELIWSSLKDSTLLMNSRLLLKHSRDMDLKVDPSFSLTWPNSARHHISMSLISKHGDTILSSTLLQVSELPTKPSMTCTSNSKLMEHRKHHSPSKKKINQPKTRNAMKFNMLFLLITFPFFFHPIQQHAD